MKLHVGAQLVGRQRELADLQEGGCQAGLVECTASNRRALEMVCVQRWISWPALMQDWLFCLLLPALPHLLVLQQLQNGIEVLRGGTRQGRVLPLLMRARQQEQRAFKANLACLEKEKSG